MGTSSQAFASRACSTAAMVAAVSSVGALVLGRFVFHASITEKNANEGRGLPDVYGKGDGAAAGLAKEASWATETGDPAGFSIVYVFAWGALGHIAAYSYLAFKSFLETDIPVPM